MQHDHLELPHVPAASSIEPPTLNEADKRQLERILGFKRRRRARLRQGLILIGLIGAMLALLMLSPGKLLVNRTRPAEPPLADEMNASPIVEKAPRAAAETHGPGPGPAVAETPLPSPEVRALQRGGHRESPETGRPRDADTMPRSISGPSVNAPATTVPAPSATDPPRTRVALKDLPQVDVTRNLAPASEGGGEAYAVRLSDSGGRPLAGAEVLLLLRMADGTLLYVPLGADPDLGTYSVTMPPLQSAPVDLRLRVVTNNTRVEIPLTP